MATVFRQMYPAHLTNESAGAITPDFGAATLINRDLSLLEFFSRVLEEALDESQPILERVKFLSIFSSILDEFFMIRVSSLKEKGHRAEVPLDGYSRPELLAEIRTRVSEMIETQMRCLCGEVLPELKRNGIELSRYSDLSEAERA